MRGCCASWRRHGRRRIALMHRPLAGGRRTCPQLLAALAFLGCREIRGRRRWRRLTSCSTRAVDAWLRWVEGREIAGLRLDRDRIGWCRIAPVGLWLGAGQRRASAPLIDIARRLAEIAPEGAA
jgi:hypothetical protein